MDLSLDGTGGVANVGIDGFGKFDQILVLRVDIANTAGGWILLGVANGCSL